MTAGPGPPSEPVPSAERRGMLGTPTTTPDQVLVTTGAQQAVDHAGQLCGRLARTVRCAAATSVLR